MAMVMGRVVPQYACEVCHREYASYYEATACEKRCRQFADSPGIIKLQLSPRTFNTLCKAKIYTIWDLSQLAEEELRNIKGLGRRSIEEVKDKLVRYGSKPCLLSVDKVRKIGRMDRMDTLENTSNNEEIEDRIFELEH